MSLVGNSDPVRACSISLVGNSDPVTASSISLVGNSDPVRACSMSLVGNSDPVRACSMSLLVLLAKVSPGHSTRSLPLRRRILDDGGGHLHDTLDEIAHWGARSAGAFNMSIALLRNSLAGLPLRVRILDDGSGHLHITCDEIANASGHLQ